MVTFIFLHDTAHDKATRRTTKRHDGRDIMSSVERRPCTVVRRVGLSCVVSHCRASCRFVARRLGRVEGRRTTHDITMRPSCRFVVRRVALSSVVSLCRPSCRFVVRRVALSSVVSLCRNSGYSDCINKPKQPEIWLLWLYLPAVTLTSRNFGFSDFINRPEQPEFRLFRMY